MKQKNNSDLKPKPEFVWIRKQGQVIGEFVVEK